jgi:hypothetical protein
VALHCGGACRGRDIFKCLILDWFCGLRGVVAILDLLFQVEFLDTLESWQLLSDLDYLVGHYFVGGDQFLGIWERLAQSSVCSIIEKLCLHLLNILDYIIIPSPAVLSFTLLSVGLDLKSILRHLLLYV